MEGRFTDTPRELTEQESHLRDRIVEEFGEDAEFTYVNREKRTAHTMRIDEALQACEHMLGGGIDAAIEVLREMYNLTQQVREMRQRKLAAESMRQSE